MTIRSESLVAPFAGERFADVEALSALISPPYDVIDPARRSTLAGRHEHNIVRLILPEGNGERYGRAGDTLRDWRTHGVLVRESEPVVYVVRQRYVPAGQGRSVTRTGLLAAVAVEPYERGHVLPHERTHRGPREDRLALLRATRAMFEALLMLAPDPDAKLADGLDRASRGPVLAAGGLDDATVEMWRVAGEDAAALCAAAGRRSLYIADGHHRYETAVAFRKEHPGADRTLALMVPRGDPGLLVLPTHRIVEGDALTADQVVDLIDARFQVTRRRLSGPDELGPLPERGCTICLANGECLEVRAGRTEEVDNRERQAESVVDRLNVAQMTAAVVDPLLGTTGGSVRYSPDPRVVWEAVQRGAAAGVLVGPTSVDTIMAVADAGGFMPRKSTYFQPKVPSGLVMLDLD